MKIVISPAKSLDYERQLPRSGGTQPEFLDQAARLNKVLRKKNPRSLSNLMDISTDLAALNWQRNQDFSMPFTIENARPAVYAFNGDVYQGLDVYTLTGEALEILQQRVRILSGLYGILKPFDLIQPYRLEMGTALKVGRKKNLYEFWRKTITDHLNKEMADDELFVNLASNEYFRAVDHKRLKVPVITPVFKDWNKDNLRVVGFFAKKARGAMVRYILEKDVQTVEDLKSFDYMDYCFSREHTLKEDEPVFVR